MNRMRMSYPVLEVSGLVRKLARDVAVARDTFEAWTHFAVSSDDARNCMAAAAAKAAQVLRAGT